MALSNKGAALFLAGGALFALSACGGNGAFLSGSTAAGSVPSQLSHRIADDASPADSTSILKKLTKNVIIGSTVDPNNGDKGPHSVNIVRTTYGLKKGQLVICNFNNSSGTAGKGTTLETLNPTPGSNPTTFAQSSKIAGCDSGAVTNSNGVYAGGLTSHKLVAFDSAGKIVKVYGPPFKGPFSDVDASNPGLYSAEYMFTSDAMTGTVVSFSINYYGNPHPLAVVSGFGTNKKSGWSALGPSGIQYYPKKDTLFVTDGVDNTVVSFNNASELLVKDEIIVKPGGKTFTCKYPHTTCGTLVHSGSPLKSPVAMTLLPNGNLIVANTVGGNTLVEMTPTGTVLATKVVDKSKTAGVFALAASGTNDGNTALYYTDTNDNNLHKLEQ